MLINRSGAHDDECVQIAHNNNPNGNNLEISFDQELQSLWIFFNIPLIKIKLLIEKKNYYEIIRLWQETNLMSCI